MSTVRSYLDLDPALQQPPRMMTEREFVAWCTSGTWAEWVDGEVILMSPVSTEHADLVTFLIHLLRGHVDEHDLGKVFCEPYQLRFARLRRRRSPDVIFVSNLRLRQLEKYHLEGPADLIVEVVSPESQSRDRRVKFLEYQSVGVREYWIADPDSKSFEAYTLGRNRKYTLIPEQDGAVHSVVLAGLFIRPEWLWRKRLPKVSTLLKQFRRKR